MKGGEESYYQQLIWLFLEWLALFLLFSPILTMVQSYRNDHKYAHYVVKSYIERIQAPFRDGYTDKISYDVGDTQQLFIRYLGKRTREIFLFDILGNKVDSIYISHSPQRLYPNRSENGFQYKETALYTIPALTPGVYTWEKSIPFLVKGSDKTSIVILYPTNTIQAYNIAGGKSYYSLFSEPTTRISFRRPIFPAISFMVRPMMRWLFTLPVEVRYISDIDLEDSQALRDAQLIVVIGHSEYWSALARKHFDQFVDNGGNALILSGNTMWWKVRYTKDCQQMICFKDRSEHQKPFLSSTGYWQYFRPVEQSIGVNFGMGGYGRKYAHSNNGFTILDTTYWVFREVKWDGKPFIHVPTKEYDGSYLDTLDQGKWRLNRTKLPFSYGKLLGYDYSTDLYHEQIGTSLIFKKNDHSGIVLNFASTDWCSPYGIGGKDSLKIQQITYRALMVLKEPFQEMEMAHFWE